MSYSPIVKWLRSRDGTAIYAEAIGNPENPHVVLAHGLGLSAAAFDDLCTDRRLLDKMYLVRRQTVRGHSTKIA